MARSAFPTSKPMRWCCAAVLVILASTRAAHAQRYFALFRDGSSATGDATDSWEPSAKSPTLDKRRLFDGPGVRLLRDTSAAPRLAPPYIELRNGDLFAGPILRFVPEREGYGPAHFVVRRSLRNTRRKSRVELPAELRIRLSSVARLVFDEPGPTASRLDEHRAAGNRAGEIVWRDGRTDVLRPGHALQWTESGVRGVGERGPFEASWAELASVRVHGDDPLAALDDACWLLDQPREPLVQTTLASGTRITYRRPFEETSRLPSGSIGVLTPWALDPVLIATDDIVLRLWRDPGEVLLSDLPVSSVREQSGLRPWPWRRNRSVLGSGLASGPLTSEFGLGTHARSELVFDLPPGAAQFSTWVGLDNRVGPGACVRCRVLRVDDGPGDPRSEIWQSGLMRGGQPPLRVGPIELKGTRRLVLVTDFAHDDRPSDADPFDIGDHVNWLLPIVRCDLRAVPRPEQELGRWIPALTGWRLPEDVWPRVRFVPAWESKNTRFSLGLVVPPARANGPLEPYALTRRLPVAFATGRFEASAAQSDSSRTWQVVDVTANGEIVPNATSLATMKSNGAYLARDWNLGPWLDETVTLGLRVQPAGDLRRPPPALSWHGVATHPLIGGLAADGRPVRPDVPLETLPPLRSKRAAEPRKRQLPEGVVVTFRGFDFTTGIDLPADSELTYELDPSWERFVAVVGLTAGYKPIGFEVRLDDRRVHQSSVLFHRDTRPEQIDVAIPPGHKTITLRVTAGAYGTSGGWAEAGFVVGQRR